MRVAALVARDRTAGVTDNNKKQKMPLPSSSCKACTESRLRLLKRVIFAAACVPVLALAVRAALGALGPDPVDTLTRNTGIWTLNFLLLTLAMATLRKLLGWSWPLRIRRMLGLFSFFYASLHLATYVVFDHFFDTPEILKDVIKRPFITAGAFSFVVLGLLAATSTKAMIRRMGTHWKPLHRLVYLGAISGVLHYLWLVKRDITGPGVYIIVLCGLLSSRLMRSRTGR